MSHFGRDAKEVLSPGGTRALLAFDIAGFGDPNRDDDTRKYIRDRFYELVDASFHASGVDGLACYREDRGDGAIIVLPPETRLAHILEPLLAQLRADLHRHNRVSVQSAQFRLRLAVHVGEVEHDGHGLVGTDVNVVFRLLDSAQIKRTLRTAGTHLAVIVSDRVYTSVVRGGGGAMVPEDYTPVQVRLKDLRTRAWLRVPGSAPVSLAEQAQLMMPTTRDVAAFTGRDDMLDRLDTLADAHPDSTCVAVLVGMPGAGKTAVAVRWAHHRSDRFPDGRIHIDLGAYSSQPMSPADALTQILREIGVEQADIPAEPQERLRLWRSWTSSRRVLLTLDDVSDSEQVQDLVAHGPGCMTLVTSRSTPEALVAEFSAALIEVPVLPSDDAVALVRTIIGADRADTEPEAVRELAARCVGLPIALRIAAAKIAVRPRRTIAELADELARAGRLTSLRTADSATVAVASVFDASYRSLHSHAQRALRLIGLVPGPTFTATTLAHLMDETKDAAARLLDELEREHLVGPVDTTRYRVHELLREYCRTRLTADEPQAAQDIAFRALLDGYRTAATHHRRRLVHPRDRIDADESRHELPADPGTDAHQAALAWFDGEWQNLAAAARAAHDAGHWETTIAIADALFDVLDLTRRLTENSEMQRLAVNAAERAGAGRSQVLALQRLALCARENGDYPAARQHAELAEELAARLREPALEGEAQRILGSVNWRLGKYQIALQNARSALRLAQASGDLRAEASALNLIAMIERRRGRYQSVYTDAETALAIWQRLGDRVNEAVALDNIARVLHGTPGRAEDALTAQGDALTLFRAFGDRRGEAVALDGMARILRRLERFEEAIPYAKQARDLRRAIGDARGEAESWDTLAHVYRALGDRTSDPQHYGSALTSAEAGLRVAREIDDRSGEAALRSDYARVLLAVGDVQHALAEAEQAVRVGADLDDPFGQAKRLENSAMVLRAAERHEAAEERMREARELREELAESGLPKE